jgi:hypothetical protein
MTQAPALRTFLDGSADLDQRMECRGMSGMDVSWRSGVELVKQLFSAVFADAVHD